MSKTEKTLNLELTVSELMTLVHELFEKKQAHNDPAIEEAYNEMLSVLTSRLRLRVSSDELNSVDLSVYLLSCNVPKCYL